MLETVVDDIVRDRGGPDGAAYWRYYDSVYIHTLPIGVYISAFIIHVCISHLHTFTSYT